MEYITHIPYDSLKCIGKARSHEQQHQLREKNVNITHISAPYCALMVRGGSHVKALGSLNAIYAKYCLVFHL